MIILTLTLGFSLCYAESWTSSSWVDIDSIQVESNGLIKATAREYLQDDTYYSMVIFIDKNNSKYYYESVEYYSITGKRLGVTSVNPKDERSWMNYKDDNRLIHEINKRAIEG